MKKEMTCIVCPMGCQLQLDIDDATLKLSVSGNNCPRGIKYAHEELTNPKRTLTTTVLLERAELTRLPVVTDGPIPKMCIRDRRKGYTDHLFLDDDEAVNLKKVLAFDIPAFMQMTPSQPKTPLTNILKNV